MPQEKWSVQECFPLDFFEPYTLTIEQWLANIAEPENRTEKWRMLVNACALVAPRIATEGLRQDPRVGYDPGHDGPYFIFKLGNNGTTCLVSPQRITLPKGVEID